MTPEHAPTPKDSREQLSARQLETLAQKQLEARSNTPETGGEDDPGKRAEAAREQLKQIEKQEEAPAPAREREEPPRVSPLTLITPHLNYEQTLKTLQNQLPRASRAFSKVIHQPAVERVSEVLEKTVMRPSVTAGAVTSAVILGGIFYVAARAYGFRLSGSELIFALIIGGLIGYVLEVAGRFTPGPHR